MKIACILLMDKGVGGVYNIVYRPSDKYCLRVFQATFANANYVNPVDAHMVNRWFDGSFMSTSLESMRPIYNKTKYNEYKVRQYRDRLVREIA